MTKEMTQQVLILGGTGRIGSKIAADLLAHTDAQVTIAGRNLEVGNRRCGQKQKPQGLPRSLTQAFFQAFLTVWCDGILSGSTKLRKFISAMSWVALEGQG